MTHIVSLWSSTDKMLCAIPWFGIGYGLNIVKDIEGPVQWTLGVPKGVSTEKEESYFRLMQEYPSQQRTILNCYKDVMLYGGILMGALQIITAVALRTLGLLSPLFTACSIIVACPFILLGAVQYNRIDRFFSQSTPNPNAFV